MFNLFKKMFKKEIIFKYIVKGYFKKKIRIFFKNNSVELYQYYMTIHETNIEGDYRKVSGDYIYGSDYRDDSGHDYLIFWDTVDMVQNITAWELDHYVTERFKK